MPSGAKADFFVSLFSWSLVSHFPPMPGNLHGCILSCFFLNIFFISAILWSNISLLFYSPTHQRQTTHTDLWNINIYKCIYEYICTHTHMRCRPSIWTKHPGVCVCFSADAVLKELKNIKTKYQLPRELSAIALHYWPHRQALGYQLASTRLWEKEARLAAKG